MADQYPRFDELPVVSGAPPGSSWGVFGEDEGLGTLNFIGREDVLRATRRVRKGQVFSLNADIGIPAPPLFGRAPLRHTMIEKADGVILDDYLDGFYPQGSSQWDALKHYADAESGFYGGVTLEQARAPGPGRIGIERWAKAGIVARGVLLDVARALGPDPLAGHPIDGATLAAVATEQAVELRPGDVLTIRTGWLEAYLALDSGARAELATAGDPPCPGLAGADVPAFLWDRRIAAVAADNPALEAAFAGQEMGLDLHRALIARLGMAVGELWKLDELAADCAADGAYEFLFTSAPLHVPGGAGSPANALAVK